MVPSPWECCLPLHPARLCEGDWVSFKLRKRVPVWGLEDGAFPGRKQNKKKKPSPTPNEGMNTLRDPGVDKKPRKSASGFWSQRGRGPTRPVATGASNQLVISGAGSGVGGAQSLRVLKTYVKKPGGMSLDITAARNRRLIDRGGQEGNASAERKRAAHSHHARN